MLNASRFETTTSTNYPKEATVMLKKILALGVLMFVFGLTALAQQPAQQAAPPAIKTHLKVGDAAPDFTLPGTDNKTYKLSDFKGKKTVVLAFYVLAFTGG
jgi:cytochrome oxidase Cu insertion factor (SCO1/SenC/PrrC family)